MVGLVAAACSAQSAAAPTARTTSGRNADGSPAAELVSPHSVTVDEQILSAQRVARCLREAGLDASVDGDGRDGFTYSVPVGRSSDAGKILEDCTHRFGLPRFTYTATEWQKLYAATVRQATCLREHNVEVPKPPSKESWIDSHGGAWIPVSYVHQQLASAPAAAVLRACPPPR